MLTIRVARRAPGRENAGWISGGRAPVRRSSGFRTSASGRAVELASVGAVLSRPVGGHRRRAPATTRRSGPGFRCSPRTQLRQIPPKRFHDEFCVAPRRDVVEYWRSGGVTGRPLFYPRSAARHGIQHPLLPPRLAGDRRDRRGLVHVSFPLGIHPVAHLYARAAEDLGIGTIWCGSGSNTAVDHSARTDPRAQADDLGRHGELCAASGQPRRGAGHRPRRVARCARSSLRPSRSRPPSARSSSAGGAPRCPISSA